MVARFRNSSSSRRRPPPRASSSRRIGRPDVPPEVEHFVAAEISSNDGKGQGISQSGFLSFSLPLAQGQPQPRYMHLAPSALCEAIGLLNFGQPAGGAPSA